MFSNMESPETSLNHSYLMHSVVAQYFRRGYCFQIVSWNIALIMINMYK